MGGEDEVSSEMKMLCDGRICPEAAEEMEEEQTMDKRLTSAGVLRHWNAAKMTSNSRVEGPVFLSDILHEWRVVIRCLSWVSW